MSLVDLTDGEVLFENIEAWRADVLSPITEGFRLSFDPVPFATVVPEATRWEDAAIRPLLADRFRYDRNFPGTRASGRQATFSSDILYDTLRRYDPDHLLLNITREEAMRGLIDFGRIEEMLERTEGRVDHMVLDRVTPFAAPLFLEVGKVPVDGMGREALMEMEAERLMQEAGLS